MTITSTGTGSVSLGVAVAGYQTFSSAGAQNNNVVSYTIEDGLNWEIGTGTYNSVAGTLSRTVTQSYNGTTYGTTAISVTTNAQVFISALAADIVNNGGNNTLGVSNGGTGLTSLTAGYIPYGNGTSAFQVSNLYSDGSNLGLGVTPSAWNAAIKAFQFGNAGVIMISNSQDVYFGSNFYYSTGYKYLNTGYASQYYQNLGAHYWLTAPSGTANATITFTQAMTLDASGNLLVGPTSQLSTERLGVSQSNNGNIAYFYNSNASFNSTGLIINVARNTTNGTFYALSYYNSGASANKFIVLDSGNCQNANNSYAAISDLKLKENIVDAKSQWNDIKSLRVVNFNFKSDQNHKQIGVIAQEVELVSPGLIQDIPDKDENGNDLGTFTKSMNYSVLYMKAVKALQEAMSRIEALEAKING